MTIIYDVEVERAGFNYCTTIRTAVSSEMQACEAAERLAAKKLYGEDWAEVVHQFFAYHIRSLTAAEYLPGFSDEPDYKVWPGSRYDY